MLPARYCETYRDWLTVPIVNFVSKQDYLLHSWEIIAIFHVRCDNLIAASMNN